MYTIRMPSGEFLEGAINIQFDLNNQIFDASGSDVVPGSYTFPLEISLASTTNRRLLDNPHLVTNAARRIRPFVWVYLYGEALFFGQMTIRTADSRKASVDVVANPMKDLRSVALNELDLGGDRAIGNTAAMLAHAKNTALSPLDFDYVFAPVYNPGFLSAGGTDDRARFQNFWNLGSAAFEVDHAYPALMPFPRVEYLLERIFSGLDFTFENRFQIDEETRRLLVYSAASLWTKDGLPTSINLKNHVSKTKSTEWLKKLMQVFNLGLFTNIFSRKISLVPLRDLINRPAVRDWSAYALGEPRVEATTAADYITFADQSDDAVFTRFPVQAGTPLLYQGEVETLEDLDTGGPYQAGIYFVRARHAYYYAPNPGASPYVFAYTELGRAPVRTGEALELPMPPLFDHQPSIISGAADVWGSNIAWIDRSGAVSYMASAEQVKQETDTPDRLLWYRGLHLNPYGGTYPLCCSMPYDGADTLVDQYSLRVNGERGLYARWWGVWHQMLKNGKPVTRQFALPVSELIAFSFEDKIRTSNMDYFCKRLQVGKPLGYGRVLVEASFISTI